MSALRYLLRLLALGCALTAAVAIAPRVRADASLQLLTVVVNILVPVGAFDPVSGRAEVTIPRGLVLQVQSDRGWKLQMRASRAAFDYLTQPAAGISKPVSDLQLREANGGRMVVPTVSFIEIAKGGTTHGWIEHAFDVIFQATSADAGGYYTVNLEFDLR